MSETVAVIDYGSGNLRSMAKSLERAAAEAGLAARIAVTSEPEAVRVADRVVLPGVGAFGDCKRGIDAIEGLRAAIEEAGVARPRPFLGVCVGMQLMADLGLEHGRHEGFHWFRGEVRPIAVSDPALKIPHMGWNALELAAAGRKHPVLAGLADGDHAYFVHSFQMALSETAPLLATVTHGGPLTAVVGRGAVVGTQFHPEKSQRVGLRLLTNFLMWRP